MKRIVRRMSLVGVLAAASMPAAAQQVPRIIVSQPWLRATPKGAPVIGGYATIRNGGGEADTLLSASIPMAAKGEIHTMSMANGVMHMRRLDAGLPVPPGATVTLAPGGDHLMFVKPTEQLKAGATVRGSLVFAKAGSVPVVFAVAGMAAKHAPGTAGAETRDAGTPAMDMGTMKGMR